MRAEQLARTLDPNDSSLDEFVRDDLRTFDDTAWGIIDLAQQWGWRGRLSSKGHVIMRAPDGQASMSVSRDSLRGRSGRNSRAELSRWIRATREADEKARRAQMPVNAFGFTEADKVESLPTLNLPNKVQNVSLLDMRGNVDLTAFWRSTPEDVLRQLVWDWVGDVEQDPLTWYCMNPTVRPPVLVAHGSKTSEDEVWTHALFLHADLVVGDLLQEIVDTVDGGQDMKVYVCTEPGCGKQFETSGALNLHEQHHKVPPPCEECGRQSKSVGGAAAHRRVHRKPEPVEVPVAGPVPDDAGDVMVTSHVSSVPSGDALTPYLEVVPAGEDAEAIVAALRALVAAPLVQQIREQRTRIADLENENEKLRKAAGDWEAKYAMIKEALAL